jgi:uncharacterized cupredoxin-like copper-binding protein
MGDFIHEGANRLRKNSLFFAAITLVAAISLMTAIHRAGHAHEEHGHFSAGEPGDPTKPARVITIKMFSQGKQKLFEPSRIKVQRGEQIRFLLENIDRRRSHEFVLATAAENQEHAEVMKRSPSMNHNTPNAKHVPALRNSELLWKFTEEGEFEFACLITGHYEDGMHGKIEVK